MRKREFEHGVMYNGDCLKVMPAVIEDQGGDMGEYQLESTRCPLCQNTVGNIILDDDVRGCGICGHKYTAEIRTIKKEEHEEFVEGYHRGKSAIKKIFF